MLNNFAGMVDWIDEFDWGFKVFFDVDGEEPFVSLSINGAFIAGTYEAHSVETAQMQAEAIACLIDLGLI